MLLLGQLFISLLGYSQYVGIGTTNPIAPLTIQGDAGNNLYSLKNNSGNDTWYWWLLPNNSLSLGETAGNPYHLVCKPGGGIGINTTPAYKLHVVGNAYETLARFETYGGPAQIQVGAGTQLVSLGSNTNYGYCGTDTQSDFSIRTGPYDRIYIKDNGFIGLGTTTPIVPLDLQAYFSQTTACFRNVTGNEANIWVYNGTSVVDFGLNNVGGYVGTVTAGDFRIRTNYAVRMFFNSTNGNVGVGTENTPERLTVNGNIKAINGSNVVDFGSNSFGGYVGTFTASDFRIRTNDAMRMFFNSTNGNVGVGTENTSERLTVNGNVKAIDGDNEVDFGLNNLGGYVGTVTAGNFRIRTNLAVRMFFRNNDGFVGVGTESPVAKLDVNGNLNVSGSIIVETPTTASLQNSWSIYNNDFGTPQYAKDKQGKVMISGVAGHSPTPGGVVFTLPTGYRPEKSMYILAATDHPYGFNRIYINAYTGEVSVVNTASNITWVSFDNINFRGI